MTSAKRSHAFLDFGLYFGLPHFFPAFEKAKTFADHFARRSVFALRDFEADEIFERTDRDD